MKVINATGVIVHTNLGRAPLADAAIAHMAGIAGGYTNLEYDLERGARGHRDEHAERLLCRLTGADAAVVVNNNAAATLIALAALAYGREVLISRGELVEIGGGFRVPDVMAQSGARLREVGTTNRTRLSDYAAAASRTDSRHPPGPSVELPDRGIHRAPGPRRARSASGSRLNVPVVEDLGSGYLRFAPSVEALREEPDVRASVAAGTDLVLFSGDKLLGGPQAGIIVGRTEPVAAVRRHPLMRALRVDKLTCAALEGTLAEFVAGRAAETVPVAAMIALSAESIGRRAEALDGATGFIRGSRGDRRWHLHDRRRQRTGIRAADAAHRSRRRSRAGNGGRSRPPERGAPGHRPHRGRARRARSAHDPARPGRVACRARRVRRHPGRLTAVNS